MNENGIEQVERPVGITIGLTVSAISIAASFLFLLIGLFGVRQVKLGGELVPVGEFLRSAGSLPVMQIVLLTPAVIGIVRRKPWSRGAMIGYWIGFGVWSFGWALTRESPGCGCNVTWLVALPFAYWYLYKNPNVHAYYRSLRMEALRREHPSSSASAERSYE